MFAGQHISKSPFEVEVGMAQGDSSKATAQGPGLEPAGNIANKATYFDVYTAGNNTDYASDVWFVEIEEACMHMFYCAF